MNDGNLNEIECRLIDETHRIPNQSDVLPPGVLYTRKFHRVPCVGEVVIVQLHWMVVKQVVWRQSKSVLLIVAWEGGLD